MVSIPCIQEPLLRLQIFRQPCASKYLVHVVLHPGPIKVKKIVEIILFPESYVDCYSLVSIKRPVLNFSPKRPGLFQILRASVHENQGNLFF